MHHLRDLALDVRRLRHAGVVRGGGRGADQHITHADLAAPVALAMIPREALHQQPGEFVFAAQEDALPRHEHVLEDQERFVSTETGVAEIDLSAFELTRVGGLPPDDVDDARCIDRNRK